MQVIQKCQIIHHQKLIKMTKNNKMINLKMNKNSKIRQLTMILKIVKLTKIILIQTLLKQLNLQIKVLNMMVPINLINKTKLIKIKQIKIIRIQLQITRQMKQTNKPNFKIALQKSTIKIIILKALIVQIQQV